MAMSTFYSWLLLCAVGVALYWYYNGRPNLLRKILSQASQTVKEPVADSSRKKKSKPRGKFAGEQISSGEGTSTPVSSTEDHSRRRKTAAPSTTNRPETGFAQPDESRQRAAADEDGNLSRKEFARQYTQVQSGTPIVPAPSQPVPGRKDRHTNKNLLPAKRKAKSDLDTSNTLTDASSTTGIDGDDDLSSVGTPPLGATTNRVTKAGDVSDMLEAPTSGPAVLRLTDPRGTMNKAPPNPPAKPFEAAETKKQRQARQKREAAKLANEEAEKERRRLMEKQIRGARMAEGTSAQSKTTSFKPPAENVWFANSRSQDQANIQRPAVPYVEELDVREPEVEPEAQGHGAVSTKPLANVASQPNPDGSVNRIKEVPGVGRTEALGASGRENGENGVSGTNGATKIGAAEPVSSEQSGTASWAEDIVSEEEQMRLLQDEQDPWKTVSSKKDRRKGGKVAESKDVSNTSEASVEPSRANGSVRGPSGNGALKTIESSNRYAVVEQDDSTWEAS